VTGDDLVVVAYQHRIGKPECPDAVGDLPDLLPGRSWRTAGVSILELVHWRSRGFHLLLPAEQNTFRYPIAARDLREARPRPHRLLKDLLFVRFAEHPTATPRAAGGMIGPIGKS
jgi:hypothetical protein